MQKKSWVELQKEDMHFSIGHFTIFSATERENLHGHNYNLYVGLKVRLTENGMAFDYRTYKKKCVTLCNLLNQTVLIPAKSKYLQIEETDDYINVFFANEKMPFLKRDVMIVPMHNITVEELSAWFIDKFVEDKAMLREHHIEEIIVKVFSAPGQSGSAHWSIEED